MALAVSANVRSLPSLPVQSEPVAVLFGIPLERLPAPRMWQVPATGPLASIRALARIGALDANPQENCRVMLAPFITEPIIQPGPASRPQIGVWNFPSPQDLRKATGLASNSPPIYVPPPKPVYCLASPIPTPNTDNLSPVKLIGAIKTGKFNVVFDVLRHNPTRVDEQDSEGRSLLAHACSNCKLRIALLLLKNGASLYLKDHRGVTPYEIAMHSGDSQLIQTIFENQ